MTQVLTLEWPRQGLEIELTRVAHSQWQWRLINHDAGIDRDVCLATVQALRRLHGEPIIVRHDAADDESPRGPENIHDRIDCLQDDLGYGLLTGSVREWWDTFQHENRHRPRLLLNLLEDLSRHVDLCHEVHGPAGSVLTEFYLAYVLGSTDNVRANLCYLEYRLLKKRDETQANRRTAGTSPAARDFPEDDDS